MDDQRKCFECGRVIHSDRGILRAERNRYRDALQGLMDAYAIRRLGGGPVHRGAYDVESRAWESALDAMGKGGG
jgi:hypothetical protein